MALAHSSGSTRRLMLRLALALGCLIVLPVVAQAAPRQAAPWCAYLGGGWGFDCSFYTLEQCLATARGLGNQCAPNPRAAWSGRNNATWNSRSNKAWRGDRW